MWAARFYKTRSIARNMVDGGKVHYNGQRSKPNELSNLGQLLHCAKVMKKDGNDRENLSPSWWSTDKQTLYEETTESLAKREEFAKQRKLHA